MARLARVVVPGLPHHVTQRGNGRARTFFGDADYALYRDLLAKIARSQRRRVGLVPDAQPRPSDPRAGDQDGLRRALSRVHRSYAGRIHERRSAPAISGKAASAAWRWTRRISMPRCATSRSIPCVPGWPVGRRTGGGRARGRIWASAKTGSPSAAETRKRVPDFAALLNAAEDEESTVRLRRAESVGRPIGSAAFLDTLEKDYGRTLSPKPGGRPRREETCALSP